MAQVLICADAHLIIFARTDINPIEHLSVNVTPPFFDCSCIMIGSSPS